MLERIVEPCERLLGDVSVDSPDSLRVVGPPPGEVPTLARVGMRLLLLPPRILALFEGVVPQEPKFAELTEEFPLLIRERVEAVLQG